MFDTIFDCSDLDICTHRYFPKDKIVYMSPDSPNALETVDVDTIYIIGENLAITVPFFNTDAYVHWV